MFKCYFVHHFSVVNLTGVGVAIVKKYEEGIKVEIF